EMQKSTAGKFHSEPSSPFTSFDHLVGAGEQWQRDSDAEGLGGLEIDDQLDLGGLLDGQITRLFALENFADVNADQTIVFRLIASVAHQPAGCDELAILEDRRHRVANAQRSKLLAPASEQCSRSDDEPAYSQLDQCGKHLIEIALRARANDL